MNIHIIQIPYDCGYKEVRQGLGPGRFIQQNLVQDLEAEGHQVNLSQIEAHSKFTIEVQTAFELNRLLSDEVKAAVTDGFFPVVLSGNCNSCLGTIAGVGADQAIFAAEGVWDCLL